jgi:hypothetical protein
MAPNIPRLMAVCNVIRNTVEKGIVICTTLTLWGLDVPFVWVAAAIDPLVIVMAIVDFLSGCCGLPYRTHIGQSTKSG